MARYTCQKQVQSQFCQKALYVMPVLSISWITLCYKWIIKLGLGNDEYTFLRFKHWTALSGLIDLVGNNLVHLGLVDKNESQVIYIINQIVIDVDFLAARYGFRKPSHTMHYSSTTMEATEHFRIYTYKSLEAHRIVSRIELAA